MLLRLHGYGPDPTGKAHSAPRPPRWKWQSLLGAEKGGYKKRRNGRKYDEKGCREREEREIGSRKGGLGLLLKCGCPPASLAWLCA